MTDLPQSSPRVDNLPPANPGPSTATGLSKLQLPGVAFSTPAFFPSISSLKTALPPADYLAVLRSLHDLAPCFLVSAYDLALSESADSLRSQLQAALDASAVVLMDSGNYEAYWKDGSDRWGQQDFHQILAEFPCSAAFSFDNQHPSADPDTHLRMLVETWQSDQAAARSSLVIPIVHDAPDRLPQLCAQVAQLCNVPMIAVAERRLGSSVFQRSRSLMSIRRALDGTGRPIGLHVLGTGNPISIALYSHAGANSFDGLEWCQTVVDHDTALLYHLSHACFFDQQTDWAEAEVSFDVRTLAHNLAFYSDWLHLLRNAIRTGDPIPFFRHNFPTRIFRNCAVAFGWDLNRS